MSWIIYSWNLDFCCCCYLMRLWFCFRTYFPWLPLALLGQRKYVCRLIMPGAGTSPDSACSFFPWHLCVRASHFSWSGLIVPATHEASSDNMIVVASSPLGSGETPYFPLGIHHSDTGEGAPSFSLVHSKEWKSRLFTFFDGVYGYRTIVFLCLAGEEQLLSKSFLSF